MNMLESIKEQFGFEQQDIRSFSPLTLAYVGDAVMEVVVRTVVIEQGNRPVNELHKISTSFVKAESQARMVLGLQEEFTEEERQIIRRGRNAKPYTTAKNASRADYHKATGFEALMGYLYLTGQAERMLLLVKKGMDLIAKNGEENE